MSQRKVVVSFLADGSTQIDAQGFQGQGCSLATKDLENLLTNGGGVDSDKRKPEFFGATHTGTNKQHN